MMPKIKMELSPVTRISGLMTVEAVVDKNKVKEARVMGTMYRGFEIMMQGRKAEDAPYFTERICGICSLAHGLVSTYAVEKAYAVKVSEPVQMLRNILLGFELLQNHLRHFYLLGLPDFVESRALPFQPQNGRDYRFNMGETQRLVNNYYQAIEISRLCHESIAIFGGKAPHNHGIVAGGVSVAPRSDLVLKARSNLQKVNTFLRDGLARDVDLLARRYEDYFRLGAGPGNFLSFGLFQLTPSGNPVLPSGVYYHGKAHPLDIEAIVTDIKYSWFTQEDHETVPDPDKPGAYTWVKAPRYKGLVMEVGPLARGVVAGIYPPRSSTMDRIVARAYETIQVGDIMAQWLDTIKLENQVDWKVKPKGELVNPVSVGATEVLRGSLYHRLKTEGDNVLEYDVITPSEWNFSPRDQNHRPGAAETALTGLPVAKIDRPVEIYRTVRSFDPCISCATHLLTPEGSLQRFVME
jgi:hydrogenase large subunit